MRISISDLSGKLSIGCTLMPLRDLMGISVRPPFKCHSCYRCFSQISSEITSAVDTVRHIWIVDCIG